MDLQIFRSLWGVTGDLRVAAERIAGEGYAGVEAEAPEPSDQARFAAILASSGLSFIAMTTTEGATPSEHRDHLARAVHRAAELDAIAITCATGSDAWSKPDAVAILAHARALEDELGIPIAHETHRGSVFFSPWSTRDLLDEVPGIKLCCDYSHWVVVTERLLDDEPEILRTCAEQCTHIHARVGYEQGPQVPDPAAPEYAVHLAAFERWWDLVWDAQQRRGVATSTLTAEYGPPDYLHTLPHTGVPVADIWAVSRWQAERERARFEQRPARAVAPGV